MQRVSASKSFAFEVAENAVFQKRPQLSSWRVLERTRERTGFMFDTLRPTDMSDRISEVMYKWRGIAGWPESKASVYACIWTPDAELGGGNYQVLFSYPARDGIQAGKFGINGLEGCPPYRTGDAFTLRYHPKHQARFYYANEMSQTTRIGLVALAIAVGGLAAFIIIGLFPK